MNRYGQSIRRGQIPAAVIDRGVRFPRHDHKPAFRIALRDECDGLLVDGMEDLASMDATQGELLGSIRVLVAGGKPVVLASGPSPEIERLIRAEPGAAIAALRAPTLRQRTTALRQTAKLRRGVVTLATLTELARGSPTIPEARSALERTLIIADLGRRPDSRGRRSAGPGQPAT